MDNLDNSFGDPFDEGPFEDSGSLTLDLDGTFLVDPVDVEAGSLHTVASFSQEYRVSPDSMAAAKNKNIKAFRKLLMLWEDHYMDIEAHQIMEFQVQPTILELTSILSDCRDIQSFFIEYPDEDTFTPENMNEIKELRKKASTLKNAIQAQGVTRNAINSGQNSVAEEVARSSYAAMEPTLRSTSVQLKKELVELRDMSPSTTAQFKVVEAKFQQLEGDVEATLKQWKGLKAEAVTAKDTGGAKHCVDWITELEAQRQSTVSEMRTLTNKLGFLPGQTNLNSTIASISAPKFSGKVDDKTDFFSFHESLEEYFEITGCFNSHMKLLKLKTDCLVEPALHAIRDCENFEEAVEELMKLFGQPRVLFANRVAEIKKLGRCPDTPIEARAWGIEMGTLVKNLSSIATNYNVESMFDGCNLVKVVEDSFRTRDLYKFRDRLKELRVRETDFSLESRSKRVKYLCEYLDVIVDDATFDIEFQMTRSYRDCENLVSGKTRQTGNKYERFEKEEKSDKYGKGGSGKNKKSFFAAAVDTDSSESSEEDEEPAPAPPPPPPKPKPAKTRIQTNKSATPKSVECKLCKEDHTHISYCERYQKTLTKDRWRLICITRTCPRCLRSDAGFRFKDREVWYNEHKLYCTDRFLCDVDHCADRPAHTANNITLCPTHREANYERMLEYAATLDKKKVPEGVKFFFNLQSVFSSTEPGPNPNLLPPQVDSNSVVIEKDVLDPAMYMLQTIKSKKGADMLVFYDSGCYGAAISERGYSLLDTVTVRAGPTKLEVAGGQVVDVEHGDEQFLLELNTDDPPARFATVTALRLDRVSSKFPEWPLTDAWNQLNSGYKADNHTEDLPSADNYVGGRDVDIMIGMKYFKYYPKLLYTLPSGLSIFKTMFKSGTGNQAILGGTSELWKNAVYSAHSMGPASFFVAEMRAYRSHCSALWTANTLTHKPAVSCQEEPRQCYSEILEDELTPVTFVAAAAPTSKLKEMLTAEDFGSSIDYRCPGCRSCTRCKNSEILDRISLQEEREQFIIEKSVSYHGELKKVMAKLPFILDPEKHLTGNYHVAKKVLQSQLRIAAKREDGPALIIRSHNKLRDKGYVERLDQLSPEEQAAANQPGYFIPWRTVESSSLSTPLRMVFDASSKTPSGFSLNCTLAKGVNMLADMLTLLVKFRIGPYAFAADISMAYNCVGLHIEHLRYHKYLWVEELDPTGEIVEMVIRTLIYGVKSAGNQTMVAFQVTADQAEQIADLRESGGPSCLKESSYMDDIIASFLTELLRASTIKGLDETLSISQMAVKDYTLSGEEPSDKVSSDGVHISLVGYLWDTKADFLLLDIKPLYFGKKHRGKLPPVVEGDILEALRPKFTRREMCGKVAGVYDPLGLVTPVTAKLKLDLREVVKMKGDWDDIIDDKLLPTWVSNLNLIQELADFRIQRSVVPVGCQPDEWELIITTDASQTVAAAAAYVCIKEGGVRRCLLTAAKSKLVSKLTVPRAELRACVLGACLGEVISRAYGQLISRKTYVTDSTVALSWINTDDRPLQVGVRNCVIQICRFTDPSQWLHIASELNPADIATRSCSDVKEIGPGSTWQNGHEWMCMEPEERPVTRFCDLTLTNSEKVAVSCEVRASDLNGIILSNAVDRLSERYQYSKYFLDPCSWPWPKYVRKIAVLIKIVRVWRKLDEKLPVVQGKANLCLDENDLAAAKRTIFAVTTREVKHFNGKDELKDSCMKEDILTYTGRFLDLAEIGNPTGVFLDLEPLSFNVPVLDRYSPVAYCIMVYAHTTLTHHGGAISTLRESMSVAHILRGRDLAIEIRKDCAFCKRYKAKTLAAEMGKIHPAQICVAPAFFNTQVDLFGPISSICKHFARREIKAYGVIFKCTTTLAVAGFVMDAYDTSSFLDAFHRFSCMFGLPHQVFIDAGSQLLKAVNSFEFSATDITGNLNGKYGVKIDYGVCPVAAHQSHGLVERSIREVKKLLNTMFRGLKMDLLKLETALFWVCNELNSLPVCLGNKYRDLENLDLITPSRLLLGRNNKRAVGPMPQGPRPTRLAKQIEDIESAWWKIWTEQKIVDLVPRPAKWRDGDPEISVGDVVVFIKDRGELGTLTWRLGKVRDVEPGRDGVIRRVTVEYKLEGETVFRSTRRSTRDVAVLCHEDDLDLPGLLSEAQRRANVELIRDCGEAGVPPPPQNS